MKSISRAILAFSLCAFLVGCASVRSTAEYYLPTGTRTYPAKPKDAPMPILADFPKEAYTQIGRLSFSTYYDFGFLRKSMEYNGRMAGADAVVLKSLDSQVRENTYFVPGYFDYIPVTNYYTTGKKGNKTTNAYTSLVPVYQPGYLQNNREVLSTIDARMIVFKNTGR